TTRAGRTRPGGAPGWPGSSGADHAAVILANHERRRARPRGSLAVRPGREQRRLARDLVLRHGHAADLRRVRMRSQLAGVLDVDEHRGAVRSESETGDLASRGTDEEASQLTRPHVGDEHLVVALACVFAGV